MNVEDPLARLGTSLREDLAAAVDQPQPIARLRRRRTTRRFAGVAAALVALAVILVAGPQLLASPGSVTIDPAGPADSTEPPPPTDAAGAGIAATPLDVGVPVAARALAVRLIGSPSLAVIDLERAEVTTYGPDAHGLPADPITGAVLIEDKFIVWQSDATVRVFAGGSSVPTLVHTPSDLDTATPDHAEPSVAVMPTLDGQAMWVTQPGQDCCGETRDGRAELVDLTTGELLVTASLPANSRPVAAVQGAVLLNAHRTVDTGDGWVGEEGSHVVRLLRDDGTLTDLSAGEALAATDELAAILECEQHEPREACRLELVDVATGTRVEVDPPTDGAWGSVSGSNVPTSTPPWPGTSRHGRILLSLAGDPIDSDPYRRTRSLVIVDTNDGAGPTATTVVDFDSKTLAATWDAHGEHVLVAVGLEPDLTVVDVQDGSFVTVHDAVPVDHYLISMH